MSRSHLLWGRRTSENDFHGPDICGGVQNPTVFICTNNQYAISVPLHKQTGAKRLADKGIGYGVDSVAVDGNDILAVYTKPKKPWTRARAVVVALPSLSV
ncbi:MAG: hypothetical protein H6617_01810 [Bdellovibrionaceae bacterium]|nr:hypothetical protein [Pseudobdellovibrionaceae bacterium]